jgi:hypothetical protein
VVDAPHPDACVLKDWENSGDVAFRHTWALAGGACDEARATALMQKWGLNIEGNSIYPTSITASEFIGKNNPCDLRLPVGRAINALEFLKFFQEPGRLDAQPTWPDGAVFPGVPMNIVGQGYQYIDNVADDGEMEVSCDGDDVAWSGGFGGIKLRRPFFEDTPVYWRAAVLVHEARHSDGTVIFPVWDHVPCLQAPAQGNDCDQEFTLSGGGPYSFEVRYLWEWATRCGDHCTQQQRWDALTAAQDLLDKRFVTRPTIGITRPPPPPPGP